MKFHYRESSAMEERRNSRMHKGYRLYPVRTLFERCTIWLEFFIHSIAQGPVIEIPSQVTMDNLYCWLYGMGVQNLNSTDCNRTCKANGTSRVCVYTFVLEHYHAMGSACGNCSRGVLEDCMHPQCITGDGTERGLMSINRMGIGPSIQVCLGDLVAVNVKNQMGGTESTIHWHGILQEGTQWMDGVPKITQCGIPESSSFRYVFFVNESGTYFYHSHTGFQKTNGHNGALIVRRPISDEPARKLYSEDKSGHVMVLTDYMHEYAELFFPGLLTRNPGIAPATFLINGLGRWRDPATNRTTQTPLATFHVQAGISYRMRIINAASMICPMQLQIENHTMTVIATDGSDVQPKTVDALVSQSGERFDIVLNASQTSGAYWIYVRGLFVCNDVDRVDQVGVLSYGTADNVTGIYPETPEPTQDNPLPFEIRLNYPNASCEASTTEICVSELEGYEDSSPSDILGETNITRMNVTFGYWEWTVETLHGTINHPTTEFNPFQLRPPVILETGIMNGISNEFPDTVMMLNRSSNASFCNEQNKPSKCANGSFCICTHVIELPYKANVELVLSDINALSFPPLSHPFHLHGYKFYVMEIARSNESLTMTGSQSPNKIPPLKDTVLIPQNGSTRIRFYTGNPGDWLFHCHFEWHMSIGMSVVFRVHGSVPPPPENFPRCESFDPIAPCNRNCSSN
ncbi:uncharacterized protein [Neodiprion pinetum]|uniref:uncharacterized protein isoform X1 n=1 Tax=Neodiprion pinetum TaxID=441929 RepID=UPI001EDFD42C|nr:laccase-2-like isoform X1 [Neodiprion pinetum]